MTGLSALWLPILLSSVIVFAASSLIHMVLPWHKNDFGKIPDEDRLREALRPLAIAPGECCVPHPTSMEEMKAPEFIAKQTQGPLLFFTVLPNGPGSMGKSLVQWFVYTVVIGIIAAYVASRALPPGAQHLRVFQMAGVAAFVGYASALWPQSIWYRRPWGTMIRTTIDGLVYALLTAGVFGWLWPR